MNAEKHDESTYLLRAACSLIGALLGAAPSPSASYTSALPVIAQIAREKAAESALMVVASGSGKNVDRANAALGSPLGVH